MKIQISYFYQIRFFKPNMIPVSTAIWDPKWFHGFKGKHFIFKDKNGVYNGIRYEAFNPHQDDAACPCNFHKIGMNGECGFIKDYTRRINSLDFNKVMSDLTKIADTIVKVERLVDDPVIVLIVYETPDNPCSERQTIINYFRSHGVDITEFKR